MKKILMILMVMAVCGFAEVPENAYVDVNVKFVYANNVNQLLIQLEEFPNEWLDLGDADVDYAKAMFAIALAAKQTGQPVKISIKSPNKVAFLYLR